MANYGLYKNINPSSITTAINSLKSKITPTQQELKTIKNGLPDTVWKANSKETLFKAFNTIDTDVYKEIEKRLDNLITIADLISEYKEAEENALTYKRLLDNADENTSLAEMNNLVKNIANYERIMAEKEINIKLKL